MNSDTDIVNRLNQRWLSHADKDVRFVLVHRDEWIRCTGLTREAADEIERLRHERDEARREVCNNEANHLPTMADPHREAKRRGWDCFKEDKQ